MRDRAEVYADAFYSIIVTEGHMNAVRNELDKFSRAIEGNEELRTALLDPRIPAVRRQQIVEDLLEGKVHPITTGLVSFVVAADRLHDLPAIASHLLERSAADSGKTVAEVRSAVPLTDDQKGRLAASLKASTGHDVDIVVVIDPSVLGGVITQIGDTVIDGSIRHRLAQLRESF